MKTLASKHRKTLVAIFEKPTSGTIIFTDIESLILSLNGKIVEREGSRIRATLNGETWRCHRPHPSKEAKKYQVEEAREFLTKAGVTP